MKGRKWEDWEIAFTQLAYKTFTIQEIANYLNRSYRAVQGVVWHGFKYTNKIKIGSKYNRLTVLSFSHNKNSHIYYKCKCECGNTVLLDTYRIYKGKTKSCGCLQKEHQLKKKIGEIGRLWFYRLQQTALRHGRIFEITHEYISKLYDKQNKKCNLSGISLILPFGKKWWGGTASLDRIDSSKGYVEGNVQFVHKHVNKMKMEFEQSYFIDMCGKIYKHSLEEYDDKTNDWW